MTHEEQAKALADFESCHGKVLKKAVTKCLVAGWPSAYLFNLVDMVKLDYALNGISGVTLLEYLKMPHSAMNVSTYLAAFYPKTSNALFDGIDRDLCARLLLVEKPRKRSAVKSLGVEFQTDINRRKGTRTVLARALDKRSDWNTVK